MTIIPPEELPDFIAVVIFAAMPEKKADKMLIVVLTDGYAKLIVREGN